MEFGDDIAEGGSQFSEEVWVEVLKTVDQTYRELVDHQVALEARNTELETMRSFQASVLGAMSDILIACDADGHVVEVNQAFLDHTGLRRDATSGVAVTSLFDKTSATALARDMAAMKLRQSIPIAERYLLGRKGEIPLDLSAAPRFDVRDRYVGAVLIGRPTGELRRAYAELEESHRALKEAQSQLVHSEKLASLGRLLAGVAHELNNPISFVYGNAHALERYASKFESYFEQVEAGAERRDLIALRHDLKLDRAVAQMRKAVTGALEGSERVRDIVESLRRLSAEGSGQIETFDVAELCRAAARWVATGRDAVARVEIDDAALFARGRPGHIQQVLMNLIQNAFDALRDTKDPLVRISLSHKAGLACVEVADNGPGIPEAAKAKIFDPFFTTKPVGQGTGLGLSISYKIVQENGGSLTVQDAAGGGAVFRLCLPEGGEE